MISASRALDLTFALLTHGDVASEYQIHSTGDQHVRTGQRDALRAGAVQPFAHFLAGLEERHRLLLDRHVGAGARITAGARRPMLDRKCPEAAQFDPITAGKSGDDFAEDCIHDVLDVALIQVGILRGYSLDEL
jgi:hypothetical protein